jgi:epsilon-lactone hydrolase
MFLRRQMQTAFHLNDIRSSREYLDALQFRTSDVEQIHLELVDDSPVRGRWFLPEMPRGTILYLHGGGYTYDLRLADQLIRLITVSSGAAIFCPAYRLTPEHSFPAQLEDSLAAYEWLLRRGVIPSQLIVVGDSAGGNLVLCLLRALRRTTLPKPAAAVCISPWIDLSNGGESITANQPFDIIDQEMIHRWARWYVRGRDPKDPDISPFYADFADFPPIYFQAGGAEILIDMIRVYCDRGLREGADIRLDVWEDMNHVFQVFGSHLPESKEALSRIGQFIVTKMGFQCDSLQI